MIFCFTSIVDIKVLNAFQFEKINEKISAVFQPAISGLK
jgi:hypothetical protein